MDEGMNGWMEGGIDGWMDGWMHVDGETLGPAHVSQTTNDPTSQDRFHKLRR